jgi:replicative DNA helicase
MNSINNGPGAAQNGASNGAPAPKLFNLPGLVPAWTSDAGAAHTARVSGLPRGPLSGFPSLDQSMGGCFPRGLSFMHGVPGAGKTALALQIAAQCQCPALFVTCEMAPVELLRRHAARVTKTFLGRFKSGEIPLEPSLALLEKAIEAAPGLHFVDATQAFAGADYLLECADMVRGNAPHLLIVLDSLHAWAETFPGGATEYDALNLAISTLRGVAHRLGASVLAVCERNRATMDGGGLSSGAGTRKIEYGAELILDLRRDLTAKQSGAGEVEVRVDLAKNRHGAPGEAARLMFSGALQSFREGGGVGK